MKIAFAVASSSQSKSYASTWNQVSILAKDKGFGQEMHQSEEPKSLYGVTSSKDYAVTYSNEHLSMPKRMNFPPKEKDPGRLHSACTDQAAPRRENVVG
ncbi:hypothetical protein Tco_1338394 [Tanacetum coccineum]